MDFSLDFSLDYHQLSVNVELTDSVVLFYKSTSLKKIFFIF